MLPEAAPATVPQKNRYLPTRKWGVSVITTSGALATMYVTTGSWDQEESLSLIGLVVMAMTSYLIPNDPANVNSP